MHNRNGGPGERVRLPQSVYGQPPMPSLVQGFGDRLPARSGAGEHCLEPVSVRGTTYVPSFSQNAQNLGEGRVIRRISER